MSFRYARDRSSCRWSDEVMSGKEYIITRDPVALAQTIQNLETAQESIREELAAKIALGKMSDDDHDTFRLMLEEMEECIAEARSRMKVH
tara:strand:+ start:6344 stop:6613 length:270 start_codon:yes stop_codon:yes gene_type:complete